MALKLSSALATRMLAHAAETPDQEVCGLLFGTVEAIVAVQPTANVAATPAMTFEIDPAALIAAHKAARAGGPPPIGCYHSHPNGVGKPSLRDRALAQTGDIWIIIADGRLIAWRMARAEPVELALTFTG